MQEIETNIGELAQFIFLKNESESKIAMTIPDLSNNKELFFFTLDLFCRGLVMLFGHDGKVVIEELREKDFEIIKHKLGLAGILTNLRVTPHDDVSLAKFYVEPPINSREIESLDNDLELTEYVFTVSTQQLLYHVNFSLIIP